MIASVVNMKFTKRYTSRGFELIKFEDYNGVECDIQRSSSCMDDLIWLGPHNADPQILASKTAQGGTGWVPYDVPDDVLMTTRMHLTRKQCWSLALRLLKFSLFNKL